jgi:hypothetical protein
MALKIHENSKFREFVIGADENGINALSSIYADQ